MKEPEVFIICLFNT